MANILNTGTYGVDTIGNISFLADYTRTGGGSASLSFAPNKKVLAIFSDGGENGGSPSIRVTFDDGTQITASNENGYFNQHWGYYDASTCWINNKQYKDKIVTRVVTSISASYSRINTQIVMID